MPQTPNPSELVIGLVGAVGTDLDLVATDVQLALNGYSYEAEEIRLSSLLGDLNWSDRLTRKPLDRHIWEHMNAGNKLRLTWKRGDALALLALTEIAAIREEKNAERCLELSRPLDRFAFILRSLKHPAEVELLRSIYRNRFVLIAAYSPRSIRRNALVAQLTKDYRSEDPKTWNFSVDQLMARDESETEPPPKTHKAPEVPSTAIQPTGDFHLHPKNSESQKPEDDSTAAVTGSNADEIDENEIKAPEFDGPLTADSEAEAALGGEQIDRRVWGQNLRDTFHRADFFVDARENVGLREALERIVQILFGHPFRTPTRDEYGLFAAEGAARQSAELGRQVGAAIATPEGEVIALGSNEVPQAGGGVYWEDAGTPPRQGDSGAEDGREFRNRVDTNDRMKRAIALEIIDQLTAKGFLKGEAGEAEAPDVLAALERTRLGDLIEFGRAVHAEMAALLDAARRGAAVKGCTLYTTTFPCHNCARHIVAAGIMRVVYVAPYAKSQAKELHKDAIDFAAAEPRPQIVQFEPFVGVAPRRYLDLFEAGKRKEDDGTVVKPVPSEALPNIRELGPDDLQTMIPEYRQREVLALDLLDEIFRTTGLGFGKEEDGDGESREPK